MRSNALPSSSPLRFVVQRHQARTLHFDFRLEREGVYRSWAVPKGVPLSAGVRHLALQVPDHTLEFGSFEGAIPAGQYGEGTIEIWDAGTYDTLKWGEMMIIVSLHGRRLLGTYHLVRFPKQGKRGWLLFRSVGHDAESGASSQPFGTPRSPT